MSRGTFFVFRVTTVVALLVLVVFGLGVGGWQLYHTYIALTPAEQVQRRLQENLLEIESYYLRLTATPLGGEEEVSHQVEIWSSPGDQLRVEATSMEEGGGEKLQVLVRSGEAAYYFEPSLKKFYPLTGDLSVKIPVLTLADYGRDLVEAGHFKLLGREDKTRHSYLVVEVIPADPHRHRCFDKVWLETESLLPVRIESYDANYCLRQITVFEQITLNPSLEAALFEIDQTAAAEQA